MEILIGNIFLAAVSMAAYVGLAKAIRFFNTLSQ